MAANGPRERNVPTETHLLPHLIFAAFFDTAANQFTNCISQPTAGYRVNLFSSAIDFCRVKSTRVLITMIYDEIIEPRYRNYKIHTNKKIKEAIFSNSSIFTELYHIVSYLTSSFLIYVTL